MQSIQFIQALLSVSLLTLVREQVLTCVQDLKITDINFNQPRQP